MMTLGRPVLWEAMFRYMQGKVSAVELSTHSRMRFGRWMGSAVASTMVLKSTTWAWQDGHEDAAGRCWAGLAAARRRLG
jgi:hypothetical protein